MKGLILILGTCLVALSSAQLCPPREVLLPCTCSESDSLIECTSVRGLFKLKELFENASSYVNDDVLFNQLSLINTPLMEMEEGAIDHLKFEVVQIWGNRNLELIAAGALNVSRNFTTKMELRANSFRNNPPVQRNIFDFINGFENLVDLTLSSNFLRSIPSNAFQNLANLERLDMEFNMLTYIGSRAFAGAPKLRSVTLQQNALGEDGLDHLPEDAFEGISERVNLDLTYNRFAHLEEKSFKTLLDRAASLTVGGPGAYFFCDDGRADWLCRHEESYRGKLRGFLCYGDIFEDIWDYCYWQNRTLLH